MSQTGEARMDMQLDTAEVQTAITEYLRRRGVTVADARQVNLVIVNHRGERISLAGCAPAVVAINVQLPDGEPYR